MKQLSSVLMCSILLLCGWIIGTNNSDTLTAKELPPVSINWQSMPIDYQISHSQQVNKLTKCTEPDTVIRVDTVYILKTKKVRTPYRVGIKDTVYYPMVFVINHEFPVSSSATDSVK